MDADVFEQFIEQLHRYVRERLIPAGAQWPNLLDAIDCWAEAEPHLRQLADRLEQGGGEAMGDATWRAPLPRTWQWLDGSAF